MRSFLVLACLAMSALAAPQLTAQPHIPDNYTSRTSNAAGVTRTFVQNNRTPSTSGQQQPVTATEIQRCLSRVGQNTVTRTVPVLRTEVVVRTRRQAVTKDATRVLLSTRTVPVTRQLSRRSTRSEILQQRPDQTRAAPYEVTRNVTVPGRWATTITGTSQPQVSSTEGSQMTTRTVTRVQGSYQTQRDSRSPVKETARVLNTERLPEQTVRMTRTITISTIPYRASYQSNTQEMPEQKKQRLPKRESI